jgi:peptide/nickel transport system substrate-binding protein
VATTTADGLTEQLRIKQGTRLEIKLTTVDQPQLIKAAELIKQSWDQIGFKTTIEVIGRDKIISDTINNRNYEALLFGQNLGSDPDPFAFWHSSQSTFPGLNLAVFSSRQIDELLETGRSSKTTEERQKIYQNFSRQLALELPAIFIYNPRYTYVQSRLLHGNTLGRIGIAADRFTTVSQWYLNTKRVWR